MIRDFRTRLRGITHGDRVFRHTCIALLAFVLVTEDLAQSPGVPTSTAVDSPMVVFGYNDLGMHCMNDDYSELIILPPFNTLHAQVIDRSEEEPDIVTEGVNVEYFLPRNTHAADKTNFWQYWPPEFGPPQPPNVGLTGAGLSGSMISTGDNDWYAPGVPLVPIDDTGREDPYPLAVITVKRQGQVMAHTQAVMPVSTEMSCFLCHDTPGISTALDILRAHDSLHGTTLEDERPVLCARCHADNALGLPGEPGVSNLSAAMHGAHATRMEPAASLLDVCYACHPGVRTQCQRDVHAAAGMTCTDCHGDMGAVGDPARIPWVNEPRCGSCHERAGFHFEQPDTLYRNSIGHKRVHCAACHGSPHAITPSTTVVDNVQAIALQGHEGVIDTCAVCHGNTPPEEFFHKVDD